MRVYVKGEGLFFYDGAEWKTFATGGTSSVDLDNIDLFGINTNAGEQNRLSVRSDGVLLTNETGDIGPRLISKLKETLHRFCFRPIFQAALK